MPRRFIQLKEWYPHTEKYFTPSDAYLEECDGSLSQDKFLLRTDKDGAIINGTEENRKLDAPIVAVAGGSFPESLFCHEQDRFISQAESLLEHRLHLRNFSNSATTTIQALLSLIAARIPLLRPGIDWFFLVVPNSDVDALHLRNSYWNRSHRYGPLLPPSKSLPTNPFDPSMILPALTSVVDVCRNFHIQPILGTGPYREMVSRQDRTFLNRKFKSQNAAEKIFASRRIFTQIVREVSQAEDVPLVDFQTELANKGHYFYDDRHLNREGQTAVAHFVASRLAKIAL